MQSFSNYASPVVLVKKKTGSYRLCVDYRRLNKKIVKDKYPLPIMEELLEQLGDATIFSVLDLKNGFFHVDVSAESRKYTAFVTPDGHYEFKKVPCGLRNSPAVFQRYVNTVFQELIRSGVVLIYMDDVIIPAENYSENLEKLCKVLIVAKKHGLSSFQWKKCKFMSKQVQFLGHIVSAGVIKPSNEKVTAVRGFPEPTTTKQVRSFSIFFFNR